MKIKIGDKEYNVDITPVIMITEKTYSKEIFEFHNGNKVYTGRVSKYGKLVVDRKKN